MNARSALLGAALALFSLPAAAEQLVRGPYLQMLTPDSVTIVWTSDVAADSLVRYGASPGSLVLTAPLAAAVTQHEVKLTGLTPGTRYYYSVGSAASTLAGNEETHYFETAPPAGAKKKFRAWIVGDSGTGDTAQAQVREAMLAYAGPDRPHLFLHMGDIAYSSGTEAEFTSNFFGGYPTILRNTAVFPTLGNHEGTSASSTTQTGPYYSAFVLPKAAEAGGVASGTEAYYSFDYGNVHFIVLNSQDVPSGPGSAMLTWLSADLAATSQDWIISYWHHPAYTKGTHDSDTEGQLVAMRQNVLPVLEAGGVDLVLAGHSHIYERSFLVDGAYDTPTTAAGHIKDPGDGRPLGAGPYQKPTGATAHGGAVYVVAGHGGANLGGSANHPLMFFSELAHGSCLLDVQGNRVGLVNVRSDGKVTDWFSLIKGHGIVVALPNGREKLAGGSTYDIRWTTVGTAATVKIEYSIDGGAHWTTIVASTPNTGTYSWSVPLVDTHLGLVRVSNASRAAMIDESNASFSISSSTPMTLLPYGSTWKYHDQGVDLGREWLSKTYDDSGWASGPGQLGYGDGDEATTLQASPVRPSYYFRKTIDLSYLVATASLKVLHDDGVAVWINGTQVFQKDMLLGTSYPVFASSGSADNEVDTVPLSLSPNPFVVGQNVIAAMVKQASATSSDVSFDLSLDVTLQSMSMGGAGGMGGMSTGGAGGMSAGGAGGMSTGGMGGAGGTGTGSTSSSSSSSSSGAGGAGSSSSTSSSGAGASTATGGSAATGGQPATGGSDATGAKPPVDGGSGGCNCEAAGAPSAPWGALSFAALALLARGRRRRAPALCGPRKGR